MIKIDFIVTNTKYQSFLFFPYCEFKDGIKVLKFYFWTEIRWAILLHYSTLTQYFNIIVKNNNCMPGTLLKSSHILTN